MKIDFDQWLYDIHKEPLMQEGVSGGEEVNLDLRSVCYNAILNNEQGMDGRTKVQRYDLALRIKNSEGVLELKLDEVALIKKQVGKIMAPLVVGQVWPMLDESERPVPVAAKTESS